MAPVLSFLSQDSDRVRVAATGADVIRFFHGLWSCDVKRLAELGEASFTFGFLLNQKGKIVAAGALWWQGQALHMSFARKDFSSAWDHIQKYLIADDVRFSEPCDHPIRFAVADAELLTRFPVHFHSTKTPLARDRISTVGGEPGSLRWASTAWWEDHGPIMIWDESGTASSFDHMLFQNLDAAEFSEWRVKQGLALYHQDYGPESFALEFPLSAGISFYKGCFLGQEVVARGTFRGKVAFGFCRLPGSHWREGPVYRADDRRQVGAITTASSVGALGRLMLGAIEDKVRLVQSDSAEAQDPKAQNNTQDIEILWGRPQ